MWCLPMGFAEVSETIEQSALRELKEETGIKGKIVSLLDATSHIGDFYGNTITISFLVKMTGGILKAGDDAADAKWFPLCDLPPLAFESNRNALNAWESFKQNLHKSD